jgi:hypothetical protein
MLKDGANSANQLDTIFLRLLPHAEKYELYELNELASARSQQ